MTPNEHEALLLRRINRARTTHGLPKLTTTGATIIRDARRHCREMAAAKELWHDEFPLPANWQVEAQNVGYGPHTLDVHKAFMNSAPHRANILGDDLTRVGIGALVIDGMLWVTENFISP